MKLRSVSSTALAKNSRRIPREGDLCYLLKRQLSPKEGNWEFIGFRQILCYHIDTEENTESLSMYVEVLIPDEFPASILHHGIQFEEIKHGIWYDRDRKNVFNYIKVHDPESVDLINQMLADNHEGDNVILEFPKDGK